MSKSIVVIVGRPNVGKSTLFNRIVHSQAAIVQDFPGVTRDRNYMDAEWEGRAFIIVDTGGFYAVPEDDIATQMKEQARYAIDEADVVIHLLDGPDGLTPHDRDLAAILRASGKPVIWAVNKIDSPQREQLLYDFYALGSDNLIAISSAHGHNIDDLMEKVIEHIKPAPVEVTEYPKIAVIGRPNAGKSTLVNALLGKDRLLVSSKPGTTRDSIDTLCTYHKKKYIFIDTAGIRRKDTHGYGLDRFAFVRAMKSIERSDVVVMLIDSTVGLVSDDQKIAGLVHEQGKSVLFVFSKWDLITEHDATMKRIQADIARKLFFFDHAPILTASGLDRTRITNIFSIIDDLMVERKKRVSGVELNAMLKTFTLPPNNGRKVKLSYITQVGAEPPRFAVFTNNPEGFDTSRLRAVERHIREQFSFTGTPIRLFIRAKDKD